MLRPCVRKGARERYRGGAGLCTADRARPLLTAAQAASSLPRLDQIPGNHRTVHSAELQAALERLQPEASSPQPAAPVARSSAAPQDPRSFLQAVMNDASVPLALRIEAAKALLSSTQPS